MQETFTYILPDSDFLPAAYGGDPIVQGGGTAEVNYLTLTTRRILLGLGYPKNGTQYLFETIEADNRFWLKISDEFYAQVVPYLTASEIASATGVLPVGGVARSTNPDFVCRTGVQNHIAITDSLGVGTSAASGTDASYLKLAIDLYGPSRNLTGVSTREFENDTHAAIILGNGGGSWGNIDRTAFSAEYPQRFDLAFNQRYRTLPFVIGADNYLHFFQATNDLAYDANLTADELRDRIYAQMLRVRAQFPDLVIIMGTSIARGTMGGATNLKISEHNANLIADYQNMGFDYLIRMDQAHPSFDPITGNTSDLTVYAGDEVHCTDAGYQAIADQVKLTMDVLVNTVTSDLSYVPAAAPPQPITDLAVSAGDTIADLSYTAPADGGSAITNYAVYYKGEDTGDQGVYRYFGDITPPNTTIQVTGLENDIEYTFDVRPQNAIGAADISNTPTGTPTSGAGAYDPTAVVGSTCVYWLDPSDASSFTLSGNLVTQAVEKSGTPATLTPGATQEPTLDVATRSLNGEPLLDFNGTGIGKTLNTTAAKLLIFGDQEFTFSFVAEKDLANQSDAFFGGEMSNGSNAFIMYQNTSSWRFFSGGGVVNSIGADDEDPHIFTIVRNAAGDLELLIDGISQGVTTGAASRAMVNFCIGAVNIDTGEFDLDGGIGEGFAWSDGAMAEADVNAGNNHLSTKYNIPYTDIVAFGV